MRSIEHGNLIDEVTAREMKRHGAYFVPTLATYAALAEEGERLGWSPAMLEKLAQVRSRGSDAIVLAMAEGVPVVLGTDLLGHMHERQSSEFLLRSGLMSPVQVLQSATIQAARLMRQEGRIGQIVPGAWADLLVVDGDPTRDADCWRSAHAGQTGACRPCVRTARCAQLEARLGPVVRAVHRGHAGLHGPGPHLVVQRDQEDFVADSHERFLDQALRLATSVSVFIASVRRSMVGSLILLKLKLPSAPVVRVRTRLWIVYCAS